MRPRRSGIVYRTKQDLNNDKCFKHRLAKIKIKRDMKKMQQQMATITDIARAYQWQSDNDLRDEQDANTYKELRCEARHEKEIGRMQQRINNAVACGGCSTSNGKKNDISAARAKTVLRQKSPESASTRAQTITSGVDHQETVTQRELSGIHAAGTKTDLRQKSPESASTQAQTITSGVDYQETLTQRELSSLQTQHTFDQWKSAKTNADKDDKIARMKIWMTTVNSTHEGEVSKQKLELDRKNERIAELELHNQEMRASLTAFETKSRTQWQQSLTQVDKNPGDQLTGSGEQIQFEKKLVLVEAVLTALSHDLDGKKPEEKAVMTGLEDAFSQYLDTSEPNSLTESLHKFNMCMEAKSAKREVQAHENRAALAKARFRDVSLTRAWNSVRDQVNDIKNKSKTDQVDVEFDSTMPSTSKQ